MNIQILDSWLRTRLDTKAGAHKIAECLSLCGPSVEKVEKRNNDWIYYIEVTNNRIDAMSVYGIAREASAILPRFGIKAKLKPIKLSIPKTPKKSLPFKIVNKPKLVKRAMGVVLTNMSNWKTPNWMKTRLEASGIRSLNAVVDITNYVMTEIGHPSHVFDYDKIKNKKFVIRESVKGEKITSFDNKTYSLPGGDIVFDDGEGEIIDLPGIIGTKNSVVNKNTKRVFFFIDTNNPKLIRKTSMTLGIRTVAATLNEKSVDPELAETALLRGIELYKKVCGAEVASKIYDIYPNKFKPKSVTVKKDFIESRLGITLTKSQISQYLSSLGFQPKWSGNNLSVRIPSFRSHDIAIPEDIVEEVARIYGYHNLPSELMPGKIPDHPISQPFDFEKKVKNILKGMGGIEIYTLSLVSKKDASTIALKLKNPLGSEAKYLRTSLMSSIVKAVDNNAGQKDPFHLFEMANIYLPKKGKLPDEKMTLAGIFCNFNYREAKGVVESLLNNLNIRFEVTPEDLQYFQPSKRIVIKSDGKILGQFGVLENDYIYYEFDVKVLQSHHNPINTFKPLAKYPPQIEDITLVLPERTKVGEVIQSIKASNKLVHSIELKDIYKDSYTFKILYQHSKKTLTDKEVEKIRKKILIELNNKYSIKIKD